MAPKTMPNRDYAETILATFSRPFPKIDLLMHFGRPLAHFWHPLASKWLPLGSRWLPFGSLLAPFGSLLHPFGSLCTQFRNPFRKKSKNAQGRPIEDKPSFAPHLPRARSGTFASGNLDPLRARRRPGRVSVCRGSAFSTSPFRTSSLEIHLEIHLF